MSITRGQVEAAPLTLQGPSESRKRRPVWRRFARSRVPTTCGTTMARMVCSSRIVSLSKFHPSSGLIRRELVIQAFIGCHLRFVVGVGVDTNGRVATVSTCSFTQPPNMEHPTVSGVTTGLKMRWSLTRWRTLMVQAAMVRPSKSRSSCFSFVECSNLTSDKGASRS